MSTQPIIKAPTTRKLDPTEARDLAEECNALPTRASEFLPFTPAGFDTVTEINFYCAKCDDPIVHSHVRLRHNQFPGPVDELRCLGICVPCGCITPFLFRFRENEMQSLVGREWRRYALQPRRTILTRIQQCLHLLIPNQR